MLWAIGIEMRAFKLLVTSLFCVLISGCWNNDAASLMQEIADQDTRTLIKLLESGVNPNSFNWDGDTPIKGAITSSQPDMVRILLEHGADPNLKIGQKSPLYFAVLINCKKCAEIIIERGGLLLQKRWMWLG